MNKNQKRNLKNYHGSNPRKAKKDRKNMRCPVCGASIQMVPASEMNFRFDLPDSDKRMYWRCSNYPRCDTYIAANPVTNQMDGIMGGPTLRHKRIVLHHWELLLCESGKMTKPVFRSMCASQIGLMKQGVVHTRYMTEMECDTILAYLQKLYENREDIHELVESRPNSSIWKQVRGLNTAANHGIKYNEDGSIMEPEASTPDAEVVEEK